MPNFHIKFLRDVTIIKSRKTHFLRQSFYKSRNSQKACCTINPLVHSFHYKGRLTKILILILEGILKKNPMSVAIMSR